MGRPYFILTATIVDEAIRVLTNYAPPRSLGTQFEVNFEDGSAFAHPSWPRLPEDCPTCGNGAPSTWGSLRSLPPAGLIVARTPEIAMLLKPVQIRELRDGMWVAVAEDSDPLVVNEAIAKALRDPGGIEVNSTLDSLTETLSDAGFTDGSADASLRLPSAPVSAVWRAARAVLWALGAALFTASAAFLLHGGVPTGADAISAGPHPLLALTVALGVAIVTAVPHELAHVVFGRRRGSVRVRVRRASATTNLTHVWAWSESPRLAAVSAGIVVDFALLTLALMLRATTGAWVATVAVTVMVMRIVWQLRFHRNCDGRHIAKMLIGNPTIDTDTRQVLTARPWTSAPRSAWLWSAVIAVGVLAELALFAVWFAPAVLRLLGVL